VIEKLVNTLFRKGVSRLVVQGKDLLTNENKDGMTPLALSLALCKTNSLPMALASDDIDIFLAKSNLQCHPEKKFTHDEIYLALKIGRCPELISCIISNTSKEYDTTRETPLICYIRQLEITGRLNINTLKVLINWRDEDLFHRSHSGHGHRGLLPLQMIVQTSLFDANIDAIRFLVSLHPDIVNKPDEYGRTPVLTACKYKNCPDV